MYNKIWTECADTNQAPNIRILQLDVLRGLAVLGIYWINVAVFGLPTGSYTVPNSLLNADWINLTIWVHSEVFVEGAMRGLFSILFGASAMVFLDEAKLAGKGLIVVDRYYRRTLLLILFGLFHSYLLLWPYDILYAYGVLGLLLFPLRKLSAHVLIGLGCFLLLVCEIDIVNSIDSFTTRIVHEHSKENSSKLNHDSKKESGIEVEDVQDLEIGVYLTNYVNIFLVQFKDVVYQHSTAMYTNYIFDIGGMMLIGMALLKYGVLSGLRSFGFYWMLFIFGFLIGGLVRGMNVYSDFVTAVNASDITRYTHINYDIGRLPLTLGYIGLIGLICQSNYFDWFSNLLSSVGRLALSNYIAQTLISIFIFYGFGFGMFALFERYQLVFVCICVWSFQIVFSIVWLRTFRLGPLEWVWRSLIYGHAQPIRK